MGGLVWNVFLLTVALTITKTGVEYIQSSILAVLAERQNRLED